MRDLKLVLWHLPSGYVPARGEVRALDVDFASSNPALLEHLNGGGRIVSHTITPVAEGGVLLSVFIEREIAVPDTAEGA